jgi:hypothetical protein
MAGHPAQQRRLVAVCLNSMFSLSSWMTRRRASVWMVTGRHGVGEAEVVGGGHSVHQQAQMVAAGDGFHHGAVDGLSFVALQQAAVSRGHNPTRPSGCGIPRQNRNLSRQ